LAINYVTEDTEKAARDESKPHGGENTGNFSHRNAEYARDVDNTEVEDNPKEKP
jgi:hypothetical protein